MGVGKEIEDGGMEKKGGCQVFFKHARCFFVAELNEV